MFRFVVSFSLLIGLFVPRLTRAQNPPPTAVWERLDQIPPSRGPAQDWVRPQKFRPFNLNPAAVAALLNRAPSEASQRVGSSLTEILLPMPDGLLTRFRFVESPVMAPELAAKFPEIKTYLGQGI